MQRNFRTDVFCLNVFQHELCLLRVRHYPTPHRSFLQALIMEEYERSSCIRGYHVYQEVWTAAVGEELVCEREPHDCSPHNSLKQSRNDSDKKVPSGPFFGFP